MRVARTGPLPINGNAERPYRSGAAGCVLARRRREENGFGLGNRFLKVLAGLELGQFRRPDRDRLAGPRVTALAGATGRDAEGAEARRTDVLPFAQGTGDAVENRVHGLFRLHFGQSGVRGYGGYQVSLVHFVLSVSLNVGQT